MTVFQISTVLLVSTTSRGSLDRSASHFLSTGANKGRGVGFNELYLTRKNGSIYKIRRHALQRFTGARTRHTAILKSVNNTKLVYIATVHGARPDGKVNRHALFRTTGKRTPKRPWNNYFEHHRGKWQAETNATCAIAADLNRDGLDDLIVCNTKRANFMYIQGSDGHLRPTLRAVHRSQRNWRQVRVADFTGDGIDDLAVVYHGENDSTLRIFVGIKNPPYFQFNASGYYTYTLPFAAPDLEAIDGKYSD